MAIRAYFCFVFWWATKVYPDSSTQIRQLLCTCFPYTWRLAPCEKNVMREVGLNVATFLEDVHNYSVHGI